MLEQIKLNVDLFGSIDTSNLDSNGEFVKKRREYLNQKVEEFKNNFEKEKQEKEQLKHGIKGLNLDENTMERKKCRLRELEEKEQKQRENYKNKEEEIKRNQAEIDDKAKRTGVIYEVLKKSRFFGSIYIVEGATLMTICPPAGIAMMTLGILAITGSSYLEKIN